ncbi:MULTISPECIES: type II toxin-antitoxin system HicB family antitoxin [unclassified Arsenophonus]|uniref:type II toxin-antitoxin system HicB family antitoxin n=1 Tax=unclassified Arsenophonus TaxID=2627083 RepID=UPI002865AB22|nr:type II toxin-antitoxin system HicB family antitoxin [Arsenophonus sp.]MDR5614580.1 type II toxin-antitoxin system HicB family antitoxin [Arsenophonus sp.]
MLYPIAIDKSSSSFGVRIPDIQGCFSGGETLNEAVESAKEAIEAHLELLLQENESLPIANSIDKYLSDSEYKNVIWAVVDVDVTRLMGKTEKINVTLPSLLIHRIDQYVASHPEYGSRSGFLAKVAAENILV